MGRGNFCDIDGGNVGCDADTQSSYNAIEDKIGKTIDYSRT